jgi:hypothetical protein
VSIAAVVTAAQAADNEVVVHLASGRQFRGVFGAASTEKQLVLRAVHGGVTLQRPIAWDRITSLAVNGNEIGPARLREMAVGQKGTESAHGRVPQTIELRDEFRSPAATFAPISAPDAPPPHVAMVAFDAAITNWDGDVETDGVVLNVAPLDLDRNLLFVGGTLDVDLFAQQQRTLDLAPNSGGYSLELVEHWTRSVAPNDFGPSGVRLRLPFGAITPELQRTWRVSPYGLVHVRFVIPGHGVFEDYRDAVRTRPFAPNRDHLEMKTGHRFLPAETLGRHD